MTIKNPSAIQNIVCGDGNDILVAGNEDALLDGGRGNNTLTGGAGKDFFVIHRRDAGSDVITNFSSARGEIIDLVGFSGKTFADLLLTQQGNDVSVELGNGQSLVLQNQQVAGIGAQNFTFQDTFVAPASYTSSDASTHQSSEGIGTVVLNGGGKGVLLSSDSQGNLTFSLNGTLYSHDSATSDTFVVTAQQGVNDYHNALRGFRHGIDKIDLRQTGITEFSQLSITQSNRGTINGLSQIHGVNVILKGVNEGDASVNLLYLDALETSQVSASDFIFADCSPDLVPAVNTDIPSTPDQSVVTLPDTSTVPPLIADKPTEISALEPIVVEPIEIPAFKPIVIKPIEPIIIKPVELKPLTPVNPKLPSSSPGSQEAGSNGVITVDKFCAKVVLGDESNIINVTSTFASVIAGNGNNKVNVTGRNADITLGNGDNNIAGSINKLIVGDGNNTVEDAATFSKIKLGEGNNQVVISGNMSTVEVGHGVNTLAFSGIMGHLIFGSDISPDRLWFRHQNQDLQISVIGSQQEVIVQNWYASSSEQPSDITAGEHATLMYRNVENLVQAMAAFAPPVSATAMLADAELQRLQPVLAANWR